MRLQVTLALICVLFPKVLTLKCYECMPELFGTCKDTQIDCPVQCASKTAIVSFGGQQREIHSKTCAPAEQCFTGSLNLWFMKMTINSECCSTDLCNSQKVEALPQQPPNGKKCYACIGKDCSEIVSCEGDEDRCISAEVNAAGIPMTMKGCATRNICAKNALRMEEAGISGDVSCCEGDLCNS